MSHERNLILVTFSYLSRGGGGIESWVQKFLSNIDLLKISYNKIEVIGLNNDGDSFVHDYHNNRIHFQLIKARIHSSFFLFPKLIVEVKMRTSFYAKRGQLDTIFIGSNFPAFPILFYKKHEFENRYIWLRSFFPKEIYSMGLRRVRKCALFLEHISLKKADKLIANGFDTKDMYEDCYNDIPGIVTIPNAVDRKLLRENNFPLERAIVKISFIGRLETNKGFDSFCSSIRLFNSSQTYSSVKFCIVGEGSLKKNAISLQKEYDNVEYVGQISNHEVYSFLSKNDCVVNLSVNTDNAGGAGLSNSLIEAIFSNNLVVAWDTASFTQVLTSDNSILVTQGNIEELVKAYIYIVCNREICKNKIEVAHEKLKDFDFEHHMDLFSKLMMGISDDSIYR